MSEALSVFDLPGLQISAGALIFLTVVLVLTGWLVPKPLVRYLREDRDARVAAAEAQVRIWQSAYETAVQSRRTSDVHVSQLMETALVTRDVLQGIPSFSSEPAEAHLHAVDEA